MTTKSIKALRNNYVYNDQPLGKTTLVPWFPWFLEFVPGYLEMVTGYLEMVPGYPGVVTVYIIGFPGYLSLSLVT